MNCLVNCRFILLSGAAAHAAWRPFLRLTMYLPSLLLRRRTLGHAQTLSPRTARAIHFSKRSPPFSVGSHTKIAAQQLVLRQAHGHKVCGRGFRELDAQTPAVATPCLGCGPHTRASAGVWHTPSKRRRTWSTFRGTTGLSFTGGPPTSPDSAARSCNARRLAFAR